MPGEEEYDDVIRTGLREQVPGGRHNPVLVRVRICEQDGGGAGILLEEPMDGLRIRGWEV